MDKLGITKEKQSEIFKKYIHFLLGVDFGIHVDDFINWTEDNNDDIEDIIG